MSVARSSFAAIPLLDGRVLVVGSDRCGLGGPGADAGSERVEVLDPTTGHWSAAESLNAPRDGFVAVRLLDGRVLVTGGVNADGTAYSSTKLFDPATGHWTSSGLLHQARWQPAVALLQDGRVLVAGGVFVSDRGRVYRELASAEVFDPAAGTWSVTGSLRFPRQGGTATTLADGRVLLTGGSGPESLTAEAYEPTAGTWAAAAASFSPAGATAQLADGSFLTAGGFEPAWDAAGEQVLQPMAAAWRHDPATGATTEATPLPAARGLAAAVTLGDGRVLVAGGTRENDRPDAASTAPRSADALLYDPDADAWAPAASMPFAITPIRMVRLADGSVLVVGGTVAGDPAVQDACPAGEPVPSVARYIPGPKPAAPVTTGSVARSDVARVAADPGAAAGVATSIDAFGLDLYRAMLADPALDLADRNAVVSPTSIALALAMARAGAKGLTASQMDSVLHASGWAWLATGLNALEQALESRNAAWSDYEGPRWLQLQIANAPFAQQGFPIESDYLDAIAQAFGAGLRLVDYQADPEAARQAINAWVSQRTRGRIPELLQPPDVTTRTRLVLVNAMYLKAQWLVSFGNDTRPAPFTRLDGSHVDVPMMELWAGGLGPTVPYVRGNGWQAVELPYMAPAASGRLAMTVVLPDDLPAFEARLTAAQLQRITAALAAEYAHAGSSVPCPGEKPGEEGPGCYPYDLNLFMPRFAIDTRANLIPSLKALGMTDAFDSESADFSGIHVPASDTDRLYVAKVIHQANIAIDEKGTVAAAATMVGMETGGGPSPVKTITLRLDRPFLFFLRDLDTGAVLFMGRVVDPSAGQ